LLGVSFGYFRLDPGHIFDPFGNAVDAVNAALDLFVLSTLRSVQIIFCEAQQFSSRPAAGAVLLFWRRS